MTHLLPLHGPSATVCSARRHGHRDPVLTLPLSSTTLGARTVNASLPHSPQVRRTLLLLPNLRGTTLLPRGLHPNAYAHHLLLKLPPSGAPLR